MTHQRGRVSNHPSAPGNQGNLIIAMVCEASHEFELVVSTNKGNTTISTRLVENPVYTYPAR